MGEKSHESDRLVITGEAVPEEPAPLARCHASSVAGVLENLRPLLSERRADVLALWPN